MFILNKTLNEINIKIEMVIPMLIAAAPAAILYFILSKTVYANVEN